MKMNRFFVAVLMSVIVVLSGYAYTLLQDPLPQNEDYEFVLVTDEVHQPVYVTHVGDDRVFIVEKQGRIRFVREDELQAEDAPFLDIRERIEAGGNEQGLLGLAFAPDFADSGSFYVYYTDLNGDTVVSRFWVSADDPDHANPDSEEIILTQDQPFENHNGGQLQFGPDGYLYIGLGDGGAGGDPQGNGQNLETYLGKILRIDVTANPYSVPENNPFRDQDGALAEIWASGLRNPWRFSFDRETGDLYIADVGQGEIEEINFQPADSTGGENYGWDFFEGSAPYEGSGDENVMVFPVAEYDHGSGDCSVTGGYVYRGAALPELQGQYFFGDYCSGNIWTMPAGGEGDFTRFVETGFNISSFGEDADGELYVTNYRNEVWKLVQRED